MFCMSCFSLVCLFSIPTLEAFSHGWEGIVWIPQVVALSSSGGLLDKRAGIRLPLPGQLQAGRPEQWVI